MLTARGPELKIQLNKRTTVKIQIFAGIHVNTTGILTGTADAAALDHAPLGAPRHGIWAGFFIFAKYSLRSEYCKNGL